eukprot:1161729-Pelagomonas_calceolata.AAC.5
MCLHACSGTAISPTGPHGTQCAHDWEQPPYLLVLMAHNARMIGNSHPTYWSSWHNISMNAQVLQTLQAACVKQ